MWKAVPKLMISCQRTLLASLMNKSKSKLYFKVSCSAISEKLSDSKLTKNYLEKFCIPEKIEISKLSSFYSSNIHIAVPEMKKIIESSEVRRGLIKTIFTAISVSLTMSLILQRCARVMVVSLILLYFSSISGIAYFVFTRIQNLNEEVESHDMNNFDKDKISRVESSLTLILYFIIGIGAISLTVVACLWKQIRISANIIKVIFP